MKTEKSKPKKRTIPEGMLCTVCRKIGRMVTGVKPRTCSECFNWPPDPKVAEERKPKARR